MKKSRNNYPDIYPAGPTYIRGIKSDNTLYISGITANNSNAQNKDIMSQLDHVSWHLDSVKGPIEKISQYAYGRSK